MKMKTPYNPDQTPKKEPGYPASDPDKKNPQPPGIDNPSDEPRPGTNPNNPFA